MLRRAAYAAVKSLLTVRPRLYKSFANIIACDSAAAIGKLKPQRERSSRRTYADEGAFLKTSILEVMRDTDKYHGITAARGICPLTVDE